MREWVGVGVRIGVRVSVLNYGTVLCCWCCCPGLEGQNSRLVVTGCLTETVHRCLDVLVTLAIDLAMATPHTVSTHNHVYHTTMTVECIVFAGDWSITL